MPTLTTSFGVLRSVGRLLVDLSAACRLLVDEDFQKLRPSGALFLREFRLYCFDWERNAARIVKTVKTGVQTDVKTARKPTGQLRDKRRENRRENRFENCVKNNVKTA